MSPSPAGSALVLDLDTRAGLCTARSLGRAGVTVAVAARDGRASGLRTRYASRRVALPAPEDDLGAFGDAILDALRSEPADVTTASIDSSVEVLHRRRDEFARLTSPALGDPDAVEIALSKERTLEVARALGVAVPRSHLTRSPAEALAAVEEVGLPCVFKPESSWRDLGGGGERLGPSLALDADHARGLAASLVRDGAPVLVQELATGSRETIKLFRASGRTVASVAMSVERTWPPLVGGSSVMRWTTAPPEDCLTAAERLVSEIGLDGYSEVEFRRDGNGTPLLMEINPRLSQSVEVAVRAGVDFPRLQFEWARGGTLPDVTAPTLGLRVGWLAGDLRLLVAALRGGVEPRPPLRGTLAGLARDYVRHRSRLEGLDLRDLRPVVGGVVFAVGRLGGSKSGS
ncbi:MAG TPA: ATP-grasp domain-containing protein [Gaiellaceae bacterium]|nr:ATP-grasp domain-containing protein [Gaiellaceae bacterium]